MTEMVYGEVSGCDDTPDFTFAMGTFLQVVATEFLMNLQFFLAALSSLSDVFVDVNRHSVFILHAVCRVGKVSRIDY